MKTYADVLARENRRVEAHRVTIEAARRRLLPYLVTVCETYGVIADDILDSRNHHPHVLLARNVLTYLAWEKCKFGPSIIADMLKKDRPETSRKLGRLRQAVSESGDFSREVSRVLKKAGRAP